ncbi:MULTISPECIES: alpha/beta hydrolase family protein [unclassified Moraxella]|uniref:alpha/beta hydrolase family protein n=1 Tax=unclassified Moraxella TaxID=2685852 RepID=UPI003AF54774
MNPTRQVLSPLAIAITATMLVACGGNNDQSSVSPNSPNNTPSKTGVASLPTGNLLAEPVNSKNVTATDLTTLFQQIEPVLSQQIAKPVCDVKVEYIHYDTVDVKGQPTDATGAVFIPTGTDPKCMGKRPIVLHAHGTATTKGYNFASVGDMTNEAGSRATMMAAMFAGQGYVVVSPNYAGYDKSKLDYHPYLNATQQAHEMADALKAGRSVLQKLNDTTKVSDNGKLFLTGFSQGGHVVMAAARYFEQLKEPVTAAMPISGPYAMGAFGDVVFGGKVMLGATFFAPLMARNYQEQYGNIYQNPSDMFATANANANDLPSLLPSKTMTDEQLIQTGTLPATAMFQKSPTGDATLDALSPADAQFGFGFDANHYLVKTSYRGAYLADMKKNPDWAIPYFQGVASIVPIVATAPENGLRKALKANDLRGYQPSFPTVMCGGNQDPMVFFDVNTGLMNTLWQSNYANQASRKLGFIDIDMTNQATRAKPIYQTIGLDTIKDNELKATATLMQQGFAQDVQKTAQAGGATGVMVKYHSLVTPYCMGVAEKMFSQY